MIEIKPYRKELKQEWDEFVKVSKNGTFLFFRDYMDYHSDRFLDCSVMIYHKAKLIALMPLAVKQGEATTTVTSHPGLTYGGLIMGKECTAVKVCEIFEQLMTYLRNQGYKELIYKAVPRIYHKYPAEEDIYALYTVCKAQFFDRDISSTIEIQNKYSWRKGKRANMIAARREGVIVKDSTDFSCYWAILEECLKTKYLSKPVHSLEEIELLHSRFPQNIRLLVAEKDGKVLGGTVLYLTDTCVHTQYFCFSKEGERYHCNELMIGYILDNFAYKRYFDYGTSSKEDERLGLNESLMSSKEGYGCRGVMYDIYSVKL